MTNSFRKQGKKNGVSIADLVSVRTLQRIQDNFAHALGVSLVIFDVETGDEITKRSNMSSFCSKLRELSEFKEICTSESVKFGEKCVDASKPITWECHSGLYSFSVPVMSGGQVVAYFKGGQVRLSNPDIGQCRRMADKYGIDFDSYLELYLETPLFTEEKLNSAIGLLRVIANTVSNLAFSGQLAKSKATELVHINELLEQEVLRKTDELSASEEKYRGIFENALDLIYTIDAGGIFVDVNNVVSKLLGWKKEDILGKHFTEFIHPEDMAIVKESFFELRERKRAITQGLRFRVKTKNGSYSYFELNSKASYDSDGELEKIDGILRNIDHSLAMERHLRKVKEKYKGLFDKMRDGVYMTNKKGEIMAFNKAAMRILGYRKLENVIGMDIKKLYCVPEDRDKLLETIRENGYAEDYVVRVKKKDGTPIYISVSSSELRDAEGNYVGVEGTFHNVTKRIELEKKLEMMRGYMENLIQHAGDGIIAVDIDRNVIVWNKGAEELFGYKADEVMGRDVSVIIPNTLRRQRTDLVKKVIKKQVVRDVETERVTKDGKTVKTSLTLSPILNSDGKVIGVSAIAKPC